MRSLAYTYIHVRRTIMSVSGTVDEFSSKPHRNLNRLYSWKLCMMFKSLLFGFSSFRLMTITWSYNACKFGQLYIDLCLSIFVSINILLFCRSIFCLIFCFLFRPDCFVLWFSACIFSSCKGKSIEHKSNTENRTNIWIQHLEKKTKICFIKTVMYKSKTINFLYQNINFNSLSKIWMKVIICGAGLAKVTSKFSTTAIISFASFL